MSDKKVKTYRARSKAMPEWYIVERQVHYGRIGIFADALIQTEEWWVQNLAPGWQDFFDLEEVIEEGESLR